MTDLICFSHLRWDFVYQRPQHLMSRAAKTCRVYFIEEPVYISGEDAYQISQSREKVSVVKLFLNADSENDRTERQSDLLDRLFFEKAIDKYIFWYYTPMMLDMSRLFKPVLTVYDCMDELSAFKNADPVLGECEDRLFKKAGLVFTGGRSLYAAKMNRHANIHCFPSSIDVEHFSQARVAGPDPADQKNIPHPRLGFFGVVDERFDTGLLREAAAMRPDFHFIIVGPVIKIDPAELPQADNIHYTGYKSYAELPAYLRGWDVALVLFALNESTRFISPTKTPEYLAAGKPVISTAITDVINTYGKSGMIQVAGSAEELVKKAEAEINKADRGEWLQNVDEFLERTSWDITWGKMKDLMTSEINLQREDLKAKEPVAHQVMLFKKGTAVTQNARVNGHAVVASKP